MAVLLTSCPPAAGPHGGAPRPPSVIAAPAPSTGPTSTPMFADVTQRAGLDFKQSSGACGMRYFVEQVASGAAMLDANGDGNLDIYFPQPKPLGVCKAKYP